MYKLVKPFFMLCETPLHAGSGNDLGIIDLPIQRERHTGFPKIEASGLKGGIRQAFERSKKMELIVQTEIGEQSQLVTDEKEKVLDLLFGPDKGDEHAAALGFTDARTLLFPVKSMKGVFAWVTCPNVLSRFIHDLKLCGLEPEFQLPKAYSAARGCQLFVNDNTNKVVLEEYTFEIEHREDEQVSKLAEWLAEHAIPKGSEYDYLRKKIKKDILVLPDDEFRDFVQLSTEVVTRVRIDPVKGTVQKGALFTEEYLPAETVLYALALAAPLFIGEKDREKLKELKEKYFFRQEKSVMDAFLKNQPAVMQLGGNATIGKGIVRVVCCHE